MTGDQRPISRREKMEMQELRDIFAEELERNGETGLASMVRGGHDNSGGGTAAIAAMQRALRRDDIGKFKPIVSMGLDKNGEVDFRINIMSIAELERPKMDELCRMMTWAIKDALQLWLDHGPPSKEQAAQSSAKSL